MSFGAYPEVSLAAARVKRDEVKAALREGADPMAPRHVKRTGMTLEEASGEFWKGRRDVTDSYRANAGRAIQMHLLPTLGKRNIGSIERADLLAELKWMDAAGLGRYIWRVRMWVSTFAHLRHTA